MKILSALALLLATLGISTPGFADEGHDPLNTLDALNHAIVSIYRVERQPSKVTVDEEYNGIINNIAWGNITADPELLNLFTEMMNAYTENRLDEKDKELLKKQYEAQVNRAFLEIKPLSHLTTEAAVHTAQQLSGSVLGGMMSAAASGIGEFTMALQANERMKMQAQGQEREYMQQRQAGEWELDKAKIRRFNNLKTSLLNAAWPLLNRYNLPDEARLTEENLNQFYAFISEKEVDKAIRMGKRLETNFSKYPPFWFYLGTFYLQNGDIKEARVCFDKFEEVNRPILRRDSFAAANARYKILTLDKSEKDEALRLLKVIEKYVAPDDWNTILFAALQYYQLGNKQKSEELLYQNIDNGYDIPLNTEILHQLQKDELNLSAIQGVAIREFKEPSQLEKLARAGNPDAQYAYGKLLPWQQAIPWMEQAAQNGHLLAKSYLILADPQKYDGEIKSVIPELHKQSNAENINAQSYYGMFLLDGIGLNKDEQKAVEWFKKAAEQGEVNSQLNLGLCYLHGRGTAKDEYKASVWIRKAAEQGHPNAQYWIGREYLDTNPQEAFFWFQKAAENGNPDAQLDLGISYIKGEGTEKNIKLATFWFQKAADQGLPRAQYYLGLQYEKSNPDLAFAWFKKSAEQGDPDAQYILGDCYLRGIGTQDNPSMSFIWFKKSAEQGNIEAQSALGVNYMNGIGTTIDQKRAFELIYKAATQGHAGAQLNLGTCYANGYGTEKNIEKARMWYQRAANQGLSEAKDALESLR